MYMRAHLTLYVGLNIPKFDSPGPMRGMGTGEGAIVNLTNSIQKKNLTFSSIFLFKLVLNYECFHWQVYY